MIDEKRYTEWSDKYNAYVTTQSKGSICYYDMFESIYGGDCINKLAELEDMMEYAEKIEVHYKPPYQYKFAVVEYSCRQGKPLKVVSYYIFGEELKTGKPLRCWTGYPSTNWSVLEDNFATEVEAQARLKELREARK